MSTGDDRTAADIESLTRAWEDALANHDLEALLACHADDASWRAR
jgi:ketosteroid isomerase-like protein